jgi:single-stranded DNA-binding protein
VCTKQVKKGSRIFVEGKLQSRKFEDKNGVKKTIVEILVDNLVLLDAKRKDAEDRLDLDQILESDFSLADLSDDDFISMMDAENETQE